MVGNQELVKPIGLLNRKDSCVGYLAYRLVQHSPYVLQGLVRGSGVGVFTSSPNDGGSKLRETLANTCAVGFS